MSQGSSDLIGPGILTMSIPNTEVIKQVRLNAHLRPMTSAALRCQRHIGVESTGKHSQSPEKSSDRKTCVGEGKDETSVGGDAHLLAMYISRTRLEQANTY